MTNSFASFPRLCAWAALLLAAAVCIGAAMAVPGFRLGQHGLGLLASQSTPLSWLWRVLGHWSIGLLAVLPSIAVIGDGERKSSRAWRMAGYLWLLGAIAYLGQGFWPLDLEDLEASANRWHSIANAIWWLSITAAAVAWALARKTATSWVIAGVTVFFWIVRALEWMPQGTYAMAGWGQLFIWLAALVQDRRGALE